MIKINHAEYAKLFDWFIKQDEISPKATGENMWVKIDGKHVPIWVCREGEDRAEDIIEKLKHSQILKDVSK